MTTHSPPLSPIIGIGPDLVLMVTGDHNAGKDFCASVWADQVFRNAGFSARVASISDATKREYAAATGADATRLLQDRAYKEEHRAALTAFFDNQVRRRPTLPDEHFRDAVQDSALVSVLLLTGIREDAPVALFGHLAAGSRVLEVRVVTTEWGKARRVAYTEGEEDALHTAEAADVDAQLAALSHRPELVFANVFGSDHARRFAAQSLLPLLDPDYSRLAGLVRAVPDFPRPGIEFRHVLNVVQTQGGLFLCTRLLADRAAHNVDAFVCCESGGFLFAAALAVRDPVRLVLMRRAGKLPPPVISEHKAQSHISSSTGDGLINAVIEMDATLLQPGHRVLVIDDVLSSGTTLCAMLRLLAKAGVQADHVDVLVVVEFPALRGRYNVRRAGFEKVKIQSLVTFAGA